MEERLKNVERRTERARGKLRHLSAVLLAALATAGAALAMPRRSDLPQARLKLSGSDGPAGLPAAAT